MFSREINGQRPTVTRFARHTILSKTATFDEKTGDLRVVIETPKGSRNKYDYDPDCDCFDLATVLPEGMFFPYDFGFVPSTIGQDGDPLDVLVLMDAPGVPGCIVRAKLVGPSELSKKRKKANGSGTIACWPWPPMRTRTKKFAP
jgi:inorganic pyrophosphatase